MHAVEIKTLVFSVSTSMVFCSCFTLVNLARGKFKMSTTSCTNLTHTSNFEKEKSLSYIKYK